VFWVFGGATPLAQNQTGCMGNTFLAISPVISGGDVGALPQDGA
jgi:hypothetical protein